MAQATAVYIANHPMDIDLFGPYAAMTDAYRSPHQINQTAPRGNHFVRNVHFHGNKTLNGYAAAYPHPLLHKGNRCPVFQLIGHVPVLLDVFVVYY